MNLYKCMINKKIDGCTISISGSKIEEKSLTGTEINNKRKICSEKIVVFLRYGI